MLSSAANPAARGDSTMPGDYEPFMGGPPRSSPFSGAGAMVPPGRTPIPQLSPLQRSALPPIGPPTGGVPGRTPFPRLPMTPSGAGRPRMRRTRMPPRHHPARIHHHRRRPLTPEIVVERRPRCHSSWGGRRVISVPLDCRPTLGLRECPRRILEIERVRRCRIRRHRPVCYDRDYDYGYDYDYDHHHHHPPQPTTLIADPITNLCLPPSNHTTAVAASALLSNLTPETIHNLPRQTVHLEPIHLPGSQADANTEVHTVILPTELINPIDGTLSVIQANPRAIDGRVTTIPSTVAAPILPQAFSLPTVGAIPMAPRGPPVVSSAMASDPTLQRFRELFQRMSLQRAQRLAPASSPPLNQPMLPVTSEFNPMNNPATYPPIINPVNALNGGFNPPTSMLSGNSLNAGLNRPTSIPTFNPSTSVNNRAYRPVNPTPPNPSDLGPYRPANITPYSNMNNRYVNNTSAQPSFSTRPAAYASTGSVASTQSFTTNVSPSSTPSRTDTNALNLSSASSSLPPTTFQPTNSMPKSILRNNPPPPTNFSYTPLSSPDVFPPPDDTRKTTRFT